MENVKNDKIGFHYILNKDTAENKPQSAAFFTIQSLAL